MKSQPGQNGRERVREREREWRFFRENVGASATRTRTITSKGSFSTEPFHINSRVINYCRVIISQRERESKRERE